MFDILRIRNYSKFSGQSGVAMVSAAILIPLFIVIGIVLFDLGRMYLNVIFVENMTLLVGKIAASRSPYGYAFPDSQVTSFVHHPSGEDPAITARRQSFLSNKRAASGAPHFTERDKKTINLAYGAMRVYNPRAYFPIPEPLGADFEPTIELANRPNCSVYFDFVAGEEPTAAINNPLDPGYAAEITRNRGRVYRVECAVPLISSQFFGGILNKDFFTINRSFVVPESGDLCLSTISAC